MSASLVAQTVLLLLFGGLNLRRLLIIVPTGCSLLLDLVYKQSVFLDEADKYTEALFLLFDTFEAFVKLFAKVFLFFRKLFDIVKLLMVRLDRRTLLKTKKLRFLIVLQSN